MSKLKKPDAPSRSEMMHIAAEAHCDLRTVIRAYAGEKDLRVLTSERIVAAARKLKLPEPAAK